MFPFPAYANAWSWRLVGWFVATQDPFPPPKQLMIETGRKEKGIGGLALLCASRVGERGGRKGERWNHFLHLVISHLSSLVSLPPLIGARGRLDPSSPKERALKKRGGERGSNRYALPLGYGRNKKCLRDRLSALTGPLPARPPFLLLSAACLFPFFVFPFHLSPMTGIASPCVLDGGRDGGTDEISRNDDGGRGEGHEGRRRRRRDPEEE